MSGSSTTMRSSSSYLVFGLLVAVCVLGFNFWRKNGNLKSQLDQIQIRLRDVSEQNLANEKIVGEKAAKLSEVETGLKQSKDALTGEQKKVAELTKQMQETQDSLQVKDAKAGAEGKLTELTEKLKATEDFLNKAKSEAEEAKKVKEELENLKKNPPKCDIVACKDPIRAVVGDLTKSLSKSVMKAGLSKGNKEVEQMTQDIVAGDDPQKPDDKAAMAPAANAQVGTERLMLVGNGQGGYQGAPSVVNMQQQGAGVLPLKDFRFQPRGAEVGKLQQPGAGQENQASHQVRDVLNGVGAKGNYLLHNLPGNQRGANVHGDVLQDLAVNQGGGKVHGDVLQDLAVNQDGAKVHGDVLQDLPVNQGGAKVHGDVLQDLAVNQDGAKVHGDVLQDLAVNQGGAEIHGDVLQDLAVNQGKANRDVPEDLPVNPAAVGGGASEVKVNMVPSADQSLKSPGDSEKKDASPPQIVAQKLPEPSLDEALLAGEGLVGVEGEVGNAPLEPVAQEDAGVDPPRHQLNLPRDEMDQQAEVNLGAEDLRKLAAAGAVEHRERGDQGRDPENQAVGDGEEAVEQVVEGDPIGLDSRELEEEGVVPDPDSAHPKV